eukprot:TRINITY_DN2801_c0_g3_i2.p1 TRINITY_DN2801_c0_g3~~TRINITY_DN2801_c0_g3_i2.p1  ORF type:complete len:305 (-),score=141.69 TRINITY_DN2801_c0_g3_i2:90-938(-)
MAEQIIKKKEFNCKFIQLRDLEPSELKWNLLNRFYNELMIPNFPDGDELDPIDVWIEMFSPNNSLYRTTILQITLAFEKNDENLELILGGAVNEYYPRSQCGLISYIVVNQKIRGSNIGTILADQSFIVLNSFAQFFHSIPKCRVIFAETNSPDLVSPEQDVMAPRIRCKVLHKMGFSLVNFNYIQPPLSENQSAAYNLLLIALKTNEICQFDPIQSKYYILNNHLRWFLEEFWDSVDYPTEGKDWESQIEQLKTPKIYISSLLDVVNDQQSLTTSNNKAKL